jgi:hypothetical protein
MADTESPKREEDEEMPLASSTTFEYVSEELDDKGSGFEQFAEVLARFLPPPEEKSVRYIFS